MSLYEVPITTIKGIGEKKAAALMKKFKTLKAIREASVAELTEAEGISEKLARNIYDFYHGDEDDEN